MAMLAEGKKNKKWSVDPRNTQWANDSDKFGQRMLQKMGWKPGVGLGANEHGITEHIKVTKNRDNFGIGANHKTEERWLTHQDDFEALLSNLNQHYGNNKSEESETVKDDTPSQSCTDLEQTSKNSKKRVHYKKFTRGKNLSLYSKKDLACILGKASEENTPSSSPKRDDSTSQPASEEEVDTSTPEDGEETPNHGIVTVTSSQSLQDYFASKMEKLKQRQNISTPQESRQNSDRDSESSDNGICFRAEKKDKKKKSKKREKEADKRQFSIGVDGDSADDSEEKQKVTKKSKKKKKKNLSHATEAQEMDGDVTNGNKEEEDNNDVTVVKKKKKSKKRKHNDSGDESKESEAVAITIDSSEQTVKKKKKKQKNTEPLPEEIEVIPSKKSKKKKKKKQRDMGE